MATVFYIDINTHIDVFTLNFFSIAGLNVQIHKRIISGGKNKGVLNATYPCELNGVNVAATSPVSFLFEAGAMADIPDSQTEKENQKRLNLKLLCA